MQPFGGRGLSGTGPKAGGPLYLGRLVATPPVFADRATHLESPVHAFAGWLDETGEHEAAATARRYADASALGAQRAMPGPVGELNLYALHPRGRILLRPATRAGLIEQMAAVLASGNTGVVEGMALPDALPAEVAGRFSRATDGVFAAALVEGDAERVRSAAQEMAARDGAIVPVHAAAVGQGLAYPLEWLLEEVSTSINTTAAGGNASLMMIG